MPRYDFELILSRPLLEVELDPLFDRTHGLVTVAVVRDERQTGRPGQAGCLWEDQQLHEAGPTARAINGWLALRERRARGGPGPRRGHLGAVRGHHPRRLTSRQDGRSA